MKITYKIYKKKVVVEDSIVTCDDEFLKETIEMLLKTSSYSPHQGFYPVLHDCFGKDLKVISMEADEDEEDIQY
ncbi:MAG: hypothetical protein NTV75_03760 [Bacteroidia bacterium]|nr:hypothetical protein [Bacteroidia bacterium]